MNEIELETLLKRSMNRSEFRITESFFSGRFIFFFERKFYETAFMLERRVWMKSYWTVAILYALLYIMAVHLGQRYMRNREKFHLYRSLVAWNILMAIFSILGTVRFLPYFIDTLNKSGLVGSVCYLETPESMPDALNGVAACWAGLYRASKLLELIDTAFIVLRKQKLIFLHWYHHAMTMVYTWYSVQEPVAYGRWFIIMNYSVHAIMYSYYACRAMRYHIPKKISIAITSLQLLQMVVGIFVNLVAAYQLAYGDGTCSVPAKNIYFSFILYFSFFLLFAHYFRTNYLVKQDKQRSKSKDLVAKKVE